jgi:hypothetical protein
LVRPYKSEILLHWRFKTVSEAKKSSTKIYKMFLAYIRAKDFPGADMARKFLQMGWTRARRYANHKGRSREAKSSVFLDPGDWRLQAEHPHGREHPPDTNMRGSCQKVHFGFH